MKAHAAGTCRIALLHPQTKTVLADDHPYMQAALRAWNKATPAEREGWHRFCCENSRSPEDVAAAEAITKRIEREASS